MKGTYTSGNDVPIRNQSWFTSLKKGGKTSLSSEKRKEKGTRKYSNL